MIPMVFEIHLDKREVDCMPFLELWSSLALSNYTIAVFNWHFQKKKKKEIWSICYAEEVSGTFTWIKRKPECTPK